MAKVKLHVEYCVKWNYAPKYNALAAEINDSEVGDDVECVGEGGRSSSFEVQVNGELVFSKLEKGHFPRAQDIINILKSKIN